MKPFVHVLHAELKKFLLTVLARLLKPDMLVLAEEMSTSLLENLDYDLQDTIVGEQLEFALDAQKLTFVERQGFCGRARSPFKAAAEHFIKKHPVSSNSFLETLRCLDPKERKRARSISDIVLLSREFPVGVSFDDVNSEWILLEVNNSVEPASSRVDHYLTSNLLYDRCFSCVKSNEYVQTSGRCLQMVLRIEEYKAAWIRMDGIRTLVTVLRGKLNFQLQYQYCFCLWVITFNPEYVEEVTKHGGIPVLSDILNDSQKDKVRRIVLAVCRNLVEKVEDWKVARFNCIQMVQCKILKHLDLFQQSRFDDEELVADIEFLSEKLQASVQDLSSFEEYATEVRSGRLDWSPVHKSERFWRENAPRLIESQCELLKILVHLLESSKDPLVLSVAAYDVGEFVRHYPRGKRFGLKLFLLMLAKTIAAR
nr:EOG090X044C [Artemia franciscana]